MTEDRGKAKKIGKREYKEKRRWKKIEKRRIWSRKGKTEVMERESGIEEKEREGGEAGGGSNFPTVVVIVSPPSPPVPHPPPSRYRFHTSQVCWCGRCYSHSSLATHMGRGAGRE